MAAHTGFQNLSETEFLKRAEQNVEALNAATVNIPPERLRIHICWGNYEGPHDFDIPLEKVISILLKARPAQILFEFANPRHEHEWKIWSDVKLPEEKVLMPGVVTHATVLVEHPELVAERICRFASVVPREQVIASTDCGFASTPRAVPEVIDSIVEAKLQSLAEGARLATKQLYG